jgi:hypothetical protein
LYNFCIVGDDVVDENKKASLSKFLNVEEKYIDEKQKNTYKNKDNEYCILTKEERKQLSLLYIRIYALSDEWNYSKEELMDLFGVSKDELEDLLLPEQLIHPYILNDNFVNGFYLGDIINRTIGWNEFEKRLFIKLDREQKIPSLLSRYEQREDVYEDLYVYKIN